MTKKTVKKSALPVETKTQEHKMSYVPILKGKLGELNALHELTNEVKAKILPLIEVPPVPWDFVNERGAKTIDDHVKSFSKKLIESWGSHYPIFIDTSLIDGDMENGALAIDFLLTELHQNGVKAIPVITLENEDRFLDCVVNHYANLKRVCLRIDLEDITDREDLNESLLAFSNKIGVSYSNIDLLLDFKGLDGLNSGQVKVYANMAKMAINAITEIDKFHSLTLAMTSFPENLSSHGANTISETPRAEWAVRNILQTASLKRLPMFGDYGISSPDMQSIDPRIMQMSASIRYTHENSWVIVKGRSVKKHSFDQFYNLSKNLFDSRFFNSEEFSWGDKLIAEKSRKEGGTGNATTWRAIGTNRHITVVVEQVNAMPLAS